MTDAAPDFVTEIARAKVNLCLHVTGLRGDGYHLLDSLVAFPALGDRIEAEPARGLSLTIDGPFASGLSAAGDNLVLRAAEALRALAPGAPGAALRLTKSLPVASGIGGGSADAAAALRALDRLWGFGLPAARLEALGLSLGADVPVCIASAPRRMAGIGEVLSPVPPLPEAWIALVNPLVETPTPAVFKALAQKDNPPVPAPPDGGWADAAALAGWLAERTRNDLFAPAAAQVGAVEEARAALAARPGCLLARMSGSGATVFGLFADRDAALDAAAALPDRWWRAAAPLG
ncbi:4-(cytidine 5'-diphospho)-2-C-methyl-D-erythritol kinase [Rhodovulum sp. DZ06]|uniref:4-(cytidine 5'-diphospho)-2-C-methyl-D-erythritol kinase n=1 Tax=Rhodovulum sp. DZ06 TaxID=3425126 RepID=UPI003D338F61